MTGNDNTFDMDAALVMATEFVLALIDKYRDQLRGLADTGRPLILGDYLDEFGGSLEVYVRHVIDDALCRGASRDEAMNVGLAFTDACSARLTALAKGVRS